MKKTENKNAMYRVSPKTMKIGAGTLPNELWVLFIEDIKSNMSEKELAEKWIGSMKFRTNQKDPKTAIGNVKRYIIDLMNIGVIS